MTILHIIAGLPRAGGMSELVPLLALEQRRLGHDVTVATVGPATADTAGRAERGGVTIIAYPGGWPRAFYNSRLLRRDLPTLVAGADVVHVHGCWTFPVWWGCYAALKCRKPLVRSPHGSLAPERLKISRWKKVLAGHFFDRRYFKRAAVILATAESEAREILSYLAGREEILKFESSEILKFESSEILKFESSEILKFESSKILKLEEKKYPRVVVIPNGVDATAFSAKPDRAGLERRWPECKGKRVVLFLSRLHPIKGTDLLVEAWGRVESSKVLKCESSKVLKCESSKVGECESSKVLKCESSKVRESTSGQSAVAVGSPYAQDAHQDNFRTLELSNFRTAPWHLLIAGPDEQGTLKRLREQVRRLGLEGSVTFGGPLYGEERATVMASADVFVLPTRNENFGLVVAEALACGVPVITTKGAPWQELPGQWDSSKVLKCESSKVGECGSSSKVLKCESSKVRESASGQSAVAVGSSLAQDSHQDNFRTLELSNSRTSPDRCGWWVDIGAEPLAEALKEAMSLTDEERHAMGENGRRLVEAKYRWTMIAKAMEKVYEGCGRSSKVREF